jgi:NAD(P)-dependent dehydrogenase (short-subunit alcohol dehydrogenase family)
MTKAFEGKTALITGGASGIGAAFARELGRLGAEAVVADRQGELAEEVSAGVRAAGGRAWATTLDVRDAAATKAVVDQVVARSGRVDYFFNNAGIAVGGEMDAYEKRDWDDVFDVNLRGVAYGIQAVYPVMIRQGSGHIVNTASIVGLVSAPGEGSYSASKHAVVGLSKALRVEARRHGVRVSVVCPGVIRTPILTGGKYGRANLPLSEEKILALFEPTRPMDVDVFAKRTLARVAADDAIIVLPAWWKAFWYLERASPTLSLKLWERMIARLRDQVTRAAAS